MGIVTERDASRLSSRDAIPSANASATTLADSIGPAPALTNRITRLVIGVVMRPPASPLAA